MSTPVLICRLSLPDYHTSFIPFISISYGVLCVVCVRSPPIRTKIIELEHIHKSQCFAVRKEEGRIGGWYIQARSHRVLGVCACMNSWASGLRHPVNKHAGVGHCEATQSSFIISHRRLGGYPDLRARVPLTSDISI